MRRYAPFAVLLLFLPQYASATTIYLTSGSTWTVPSDWNSSHNTIEAIGNGSDAGGDLRGGGGGGAYSKSVNVTLTPGATIFYSVAHIPLTWPGDSTAGHTIAQNSGDSYLCNSTSNCASLRGSAVVVGAEGGKGTVNSPYGPYPIDAIGGAGGLDGNGIATGPGAVRYSGGAGGNCANDLNCGSDSSPGSGGGAAGPHGNGSSGTSGTSGGGGIGGFYSVQTPSSGGAADAGYGGAGGGGGGTGGSGQEWGSSYGSGGGGGGGNYGGAGGSGGRYGGGGGGGADDGNGLYPSADASAPGGGGLIVVTYIPVPSCTLTLSPTTIPYGSSATLTWSTGNAGGLYIDQLGYVTLPSGSTTVSPSTSTDYSGTVSSTGGVAYCTASGTTPAGTLTVTPPATPTTAITASSTSIFVGQSTGIKATFAAASNDTLTHDNIDSPVGTGVGATTNPDAVKYYTFTPSSPGTYTFYARAQTSYYSSWTTYSSVTVTVTASPQCSVSLSPTSVSQGSPSTLSYTSSNASTFSINHIGSVTPNTSGSTGVSPSQTTDYTGTVTAGGVTNTCPASLTVSCTPSYSCSSNVIQHTDSSCNVSTVTTCNAPSFCSAGSSVCLFPPPSFNQSGPLSGHLQAIPLLVPQNLPTKLFWDVANVSSCTVTGSDGETFSGTSSGSSGKSTLPMQQQTSFTLACTGDDGSSAHEVLVVNIAPIFNER